MNMKKWLKTILLFPAMLLLGAGQEGGAVPVNQAAESDADQDDLEAELDADSAEDQEDEEETEEGQEAGEEPTEGNKDKGAHQTTLEERAAEIGKKHAEEAIAKFKAEQEAIQKEAQARIEADRKPFIELSTEASAKLNSDYAAAIAHVADLNELIRLGDQSPDTILSLRQTQKWITDTENWYTDNETKKSEWVSKQSESQKASAEAVERANRLQTTAEVFREASQIPQEAWDTASIWFSEQLKTDKVLGLEFQDAYRKGDVAAVKFAHDYCTTHMGKSAEEVLAQKEAAKQKLSPSVSGRVDQTAETAMKNLRELHAKAQKSGEEEDFKAFAAAKRKAGVSGSIFTKRKAA